MTSLPRMRLVDFDEPVDSRSSRRITLDPAGGDELAGRARRAILCARQRLLSQQRADHRWVGTTRTDATLACQLVFLNAYLGHEDATLDDQLASSILNDQQPLGGWARYPGGPTDVSVSVQAYLALRIIGMDPAIQRLRQARRAILAAGGADRCDTTTRCWLALLGQIDYDACPPLPAEWLLSRSVRRRWLRKSDRANGSATLAARSIAWCHRATRHVGIDGTIRELFVEHPQDWPAPADAAADDRFSKIAKRITSWLEHRGWVPLRCRGLDRAEQEILRQLQGDDVCDQGFEETVWQVVALDALGHTSECAELERCWTRLQVLIDIDEGENYATCQPATTPLADTSAALQAIISSGARLADYELAGVFDQLMQAATATTARPLVPTELAGLLRTLRQVIEGDTANASALPPTITILRDEDELVGDHVDRPPIPTSRINSAAAQLAAQLCRMQNPDGGWAAFPNGGSNGASSPDVTGAAIMALCDWRVEDVDLAIRAGIDFLRHAQQPNGSWNSDTGVRFCHGTTFALQGLLAAKVVNDDPTIVAGVNWLLSEQQSGGGWAESPAATLDRATADPSPTQTAWALQALLAAGMSTSASVARGISHLLDTQQATGEWREWQLVLRTCRGESWQQNELLSTCEPLVALARWATQFADEAQHDPFELQLVAAE